MSWNPFSRGGIIALAVVILVGMLTGIMGDFSGLEEGGIKAYFALLCVLGFGVYLFFMGFEERRKLSLVLETPTSKIRSLAMGQVEVYGSVVPAKEKVLLSPFEKKPCVQYSCKAEEYRSSGKSGHWATVFAETKSKIFFLEDETGAVLVNPEDAELDLKQDYSWQTGWGKQMPANVSSFLAANKLSAKTFLGSKSMRFSETRIEPDDHIYINGTAGKNPYVKLAPSNAENIMLQKGGEDATFFIADKTEKEVVTTLRWRVFGGLAGGSVLILGSMLLLFLMTGIL